jgi:hypothetical protein
MAGSGFSFTSTNARGRSGYNKDGSSDGDEGSQFLCFGRSGYNKGNSDDNDENKRFACYGRSGYNKSVQPSFLMY